MYAVGSETQTQRCETRSTCCGVYATLIPRDPLGTRLGLRSRKHTGSDPGRAMGSVHAVHAGGYWHLENWSSLID